MNQSFDAILVVSFGGPEAMDEVMPFLENVLRGRNVPRERMQEVAHHYELFDGVSPINAQNRALIAALREELQEGGLRLPIYWGNRNWHPMLADTVRQMALDGIKHALAFVTSAYNSYSGCRQYLENIEQARREVGEGAPQIEKLRTFYNHPGFIQANAEHVRAAFERIPAERRAGAHLAFTAHSIPKAMADNSDYEAQLLEAARLVAEASGRDDWRLVFQSRSGPPAQPWLEPDILDYLRELKAAGAGDLVVSPIGFISDHMEVLYDLDTEAQRLAEELNIKMIRAATAGTHPAFIRMIRELVTERMRPETAPRFLGTRGVKTCGYPADCCPQGLTRPAPPKTEA
jgi:protoporphyrin/coproporphyrin ferrochelatase